MKYLEPSFSTMAPPGEDYRDNWDRIFGKKTEGQTTVAAIEGDTGTTQAITDPDGAALCDPPSSEGEPPGEALLFVEKTTTDPSEQLIELAKVIIRYGCLAWRHKSIEEDLMIVLNRLGRPYVD